MQVGYGLAKLKRFFDIAETLQLVTSLGLSKLYYGAPVWLSRNLHDFNLRKLLRASTSLILSCTTRQDWSMISYEEIHKIVNKPTPKMMSDFIQATTLKSIIATERPQMVWQKLQSNYVENLRTGKCWFVNGSTNLAGKGNFGNRVQYISSKLPQGWMNWSKWKFKKECKRMFWHA